MVEDVAIRQPLGAQTVQTYMRGVGSSDSVMIAVQAAILLRLIERLESRFINGLL